MEELDTISSADLASLLSEKVDTSEVVEEQTPEVIPTKEVVTVTSSTSIAKAVDEYVHPKPKKVVSTDRQVARIKDSINVNLEKYINVKSSINDRIQALSKVVDGVVRQPKKDILDTILTFFIKNRDNALLQETAALQGITQLDSDLHFKTRVFYTVMMSLARGTATKRNTNVEAIRSIFRSDDFPTWVAIQIARRSR